MKSARLAGQRLPFQGGGWEGMGYDLLNLAQTSTQIPNLRAPCSLHLDE